MTFAKLRRLFFWVALVLVLDQCTKALIVAELALGQAIPVIPYFFDIVHVQNRGAAFGIFATIAEPYRFLLLTVIAGGAVVLLLFYYLSFPYKARRIQIPLAFIVGGALGNVLDRLMRGGVVDFLSFHWYDRWTHGSWLGLSWSFRLEWPAFNVADMAISLSVVWLLFALSRASDPSALPQGERGRLL